MKYLLLLLLVVSCSDGPSQTELNVKRLTLEAKAVCSCHRGINSLVIGSVSLTAICNDNYYVEIKEPNGLDYIHIEGCGK
jgi:hypothetical protein